MGNCPLHITPSSAPSPDSLTTLLPGSVGIPSSATHTSSPSKRIVPGVLPISKLPISVPSSPNRSTSVFNVVQPPDARHPNTLTIRLQMRRRNQAQVELLNPRRYVPGFETIGIGVGIAACPKPHPTPTKIVTKANVANARIFSNVHLYLRTPYRYISFKPPYSIRSRLVVE